LLKALGLMATDYSVATVKDALAVLAAPAPPVVAPANGGAAAVAPPVAGGARLSFACIPPLELPAAAEVPDDVAAYRRAVVDAAVAVAGRLCLGGVLAVGVHDLRRTCAHRFPGQRQVAVLWPLAVLVWHDLRSALPPWMALKEMVIVVPRQHGRRRYACARRPTRTCARAPCLADWHRRAHRGSGSPAGTTRTSRRRTRATPTRRRSCRSCTVHTSSL